MGKDDGMRETLVTASGFRMRAWTDDDVSALLRAFEPAEMRWQQPGPPIDNPEAALAWIAKRRFAWETGTGYTFAVTDADDDILGCMSVTAINRDHEIGWVAYWTMEHARGRGVATDAARAITDWAFAELGLFRLETGHRTDNVASCKVATRAGYAVEGIERAKLRYGDRRYDTEAHARLRTDKIDQTDEIG
jgi:RimJ/RimL family protein N-acetyltransferase